MNIRYILVIGSLLLNHQISFGQYEGDLQNLIKGHLNNLKAAYFSNRIEAIMPYVHPNIINFYKGEEATLAYIKQKIEQDKKMGFTTLSIDYIDPIEVKSYKDELHCLVTKQFITRHIMNDFEILSYMLGISNDNGRSWVFIEGSRLEGKYKKLFFPDLETPFEIPKIEIRPLFSISDPRNPDKNDPNIRDFMKKYKEKTGETFTDE